MTGVLMIFRLHFALLSPALLRLVAGDRQQTVPAHESDDQMSDVLARYIQPMDRQLATTFISFHHLVRNEE